MRVSLLRREYYHSGAVTNAPAVGSILKNDYGNNQLMTITLLFYFALALGPFS